MKIIKIALMALLLVTAMSGPASAQTFEEDVTNPSELTTGVAILLVGLLGILTVSTVFLNSPVALLGLSAVYLTLLAGLLNLTGFRSFYIVVTIQAMTLAATGAYRT